MVKNSVQLKKVKVFKQKIWNLKYTDNKFSLHIRARDGKCMRCGSADKSLDNSHYWRRDMKGTRFDPNNCIALCRECHTIWERQQNPEYKAWMIRWLGEEEYQAVEHRARSYKHQRTAITECMNLLNN